MALSAARVVSLAPSLARRAVDQTPVWRMADVLRLKPDLAGAADLASRQLPREGRIVGLVAGERGGKTAYLEIEVLSSTAAMERGCRFWLTPQRAGLLYERVVAAPVKPRVAPRLLALA